MRKRMNTELIKLFRVKKFSLLLRTFLILFCCVGIDALADFYISMALSEATYPVYTLSGFFIVSLLASPLQAGYSDLYRRKRVLLIALASTLISFILLSSLNSNLGLSVCILIILLKSGFGNITEVAWSAMGDEKLGTEYSRLVFALSNCCMGTAALIFRFFRFYKVLFILHILSGRPAPANPLAWTYGSCAVFTLLLMMAVIFCYKDRHDTDISPQKIKKERPRFIFHTVLKHLSSSFHSERFRLGMTVFFFWEIAFYLIHQLGVDLPIRPFTSVTPYMAGGYVLGTFVLPILHKLDDHKLITAGHILAIAPLPIAIFLSLFTQISPKLLIDGCFAIYSFGTAFLSPCIFATLSNEKKVHEQGVLFGVFGSVDVAATLGALVLGWLCKNLIVVINLKIQIAL